MHTIEETYQPSLVEKAVQSAWKERKAYEVTEDKSKQKYYACSMLPYPSGKLHMGHVRNYTINDMLARWLRMHGLNVLMPMGWDAFGLPAENAAIKNKQPPAQWTYDNIAYMKKQMQSMGLAIDWSREFATCDADYYRWNQWLFLQMLNKGIAYRKTQVINWDPVDQTVLANEQVIDGKGWRTGALVEKREIPGYYLNITSYTEELLRNVSDSTAPDFLSGWPERVRLMQENWLGKSQGLRFAFPHSITHSNGHPIQNGKLYVFTTRADTIMGITFCAVAPEHPLALHAAAGNPEIAAFIETCKKGSNTEAELATKEKVGLPLGLTVSHPLTGAELPLWVGNYVLMGYGDGAVMGVPAHDERDFAFAQKYNIPIQQVLAPNPDLAKPGRPNPIAFSDQTWAEWYADKQHGGCIHSGELNGLKHNEAIDQVAKMLATKGLGEKQTTWRLRDWGISRQRYWGTPIPIVHCPDCGAVPEKEENLPVLLPQDLLPNGSGNPLNQCEAFLHTTCPQCGTAARRETDTMDTFVDSSWYFMRYCDAHDDKAMVAAGTQYWMQGGMDQYIGGIEHAILHLLYARFWTKVMRDLGLVNISEPFQRLLTQGMVLNVIYSQSKNNGGVEYFWPRDVEQVFDDTGKVLSAKLKNAVGNWPAGTPVRYEGIGTMSKSKNNGVDPQDLIHRYGADTARLYTMFTAPPEATLEWNDSAVDGSYRFLRRVWAFAYKHGDMLQTACTSDHSQTHLRVPAKTVRRELHLVLKQVRFDYKRMQYNTVVSGCMKMLNALEGLAFDGSPGDQAVVCEGLSLLLRVLYPVTPHIATHLWQGLGYASVLGDLLDAPWPEEDPQALQQDALDLVVQVNGKLRGNITVPAQATTTEIESLVLASPTLKKWIAEKTVKKIIVVPNRLVNIVA